MTAALAAPPSAIVGSVTPRIWTKPLITGPPGPCVCGCALTPETSFGWDLIQFAEDVGWPLDPWQQWTAIHLGELLPDGSPRFRTLLIIVGRQNGKTILSRVLFLYWMFVDQAPLIVGTSLSRAKAKETWSKVIDLAKKYKHLARELPKVYRRDTTGEEDFWCQHSEEDCARGPGCEHEPHYQFAAPTKDAGRGGTVHRALIDELRQQKNFECWSALDSASNAVWDAQRVAISNMGGLQSVVLHDLRDAALRWIETSQGDETTGLFEWSTPADADPEDLAALAQANPDLGNRVRARVLLAQARKAKAAGGEQLTEFETEVMCKAPSNEAPIGVDLARWATLADPDPANLAEHRARVALVLEVALDGQTACLAAAGLLPDSKVHVEIIETWTSTADLRKDLPDIVDRIKPRALGWFPNSPTAGVIAGIKTIPGRRRWPPPRVKLEPITGEDTQVCMGFNEQIDAGDIAHPDDPLLNAQLENITRADRGDGAYVFSRRKSGPIHVVYAVAGAVHLARMLPPPPPPLTIA